MPSRSVVPMRRPGARRELMWRPSALRVDALPSCATPRGVRENPGFLGFARLYPAGHYRVYPIDTVSYRRFLDG
jgi:hypothetical protein